MIITKDTIDTAKLKEIYTNIPPINDNISSSGINAMRALLPVEEHREPILFVSQDDITNYDKYTEFITQTIQVFGNLDNIKCARNGTQDGRSAIQYITEIAEYNGWSADMDMTNPLVNKLMNVIILLFLLNELRLFIILFVNVCLYVLIMFVS